MLLGASKVRITPFTNDRTCELPVALRIDFFPSFSSSFSSTLVNASPVHAMLNYTNILLVAIFLTHFIPTAAIKAASGDICDISIYGKPDYSSCITLLYGSPQLRGAGIYNIDNVEHGFLLPYFGSSGQFTINQWRHRVTLPEVWANGMYVCISCKLVPAQIHFLIVGKVTMSTRVQS